MRVLFLGDIFGKPGRRAVVQAIRSIRLELGLDLVLANAENASGGLGLIPKNAQQLHESGIDILTSGNHIWKHKEIYPFLDASPWLLRPANYPPEAPGRGFGIFAVGAVQVAVINLLGRTFMKPVDCPFRAADAVLSELDGRFRVILLDFHAEATSEKKALGYYLDGRVSCLLGTHTHVQTNDAQILEKNTGYLTDIGMCGPHPSVLGMDPGVVQKGFVQGLPQRFVLAQGRVLLQGALVDIDERDGYPRSVEVWERWSEC